MQAAVTGMVTLMYLIKYSSASGKCVTHGTEKSQAMVIAMP